MGLQRTIRVGGEILAGALAGVLFATIAGMGAANAESEPGSAGANTVAQAQPSVGDIVIGEIEKRILNDYYRRNAETWVAANPDEAANWTTPPAGWPEVYMTPVSQMGTPEASAAP